MQYFRISSVAFDLVSVAVLFLLDCFLSVSVSHLLPLLQLEGKEITHTHNIPKQPHKQLKYAE